MDKLAAFAALIALAGVAWLALGQDAKNGSTGVSEQVEQLRAEQATLASRIDKLLATRQPALMSGSGAAATAEGGPVLHTNPDAAVAAASNAPMNERMAQLEERIRKQDEEMATLKKDRPTAQMHMAPFGGKRWLRSPDQAATALEMSDAQKSDMERSLENAKHELDRLYDTQDENGDTVSALQKKMGEEIKNRKGDQPFSNIVSHIAKLSAFKQRTIPGSDETFAQAERRIKKNAMGEIRRGLTPDQQKKWDNSRTAGLLPGHGTTAVSTMVVGDGGGAFFGGVEVKDK